MKKVLLVLAAVALFTSCGKTLSGGGGEVTGVRSVAFNEPAPYGMVLIKRGSFEMGPADKDSLWGINPETKGVSFDAFWMDETEVTNAKYRQFVYWVRDSIIRERLADPAYGGNDLFKITEDKYGEPVTPHLDWSRPIPWKRANEDEIRAIESVYTVNPVTGEKTLDPKQMVYRYEWYDYTSAALRKHNLDPAARVRNTDIQVDPDEVIMISKDTAYITEEGEIVNETITRRLSGPWDFLHTRIVNIYPDESCWVNDFNNAYNEPYMRMYFSHPGYDDYPVVGVSWEQATAFCVWRTNLFKESLNFPSGQALEPFRLPTEGEWEYAARTGKNENKYPWVVTIAKKEYSNLYARQVFVAIDFKFSSIAKYIDKVSIGQRGYCYIINSKGEIIYHPQQQILFSGLKKENTDEIFDLADGIHRKRNNIYNISSLASCNWKIVGVSFNDEITQAVKSQIIIGSAFAILFSLFISVLVYFILSRTVTRPVRRLVDSMQKFEKQAESFEYKADMSNVVEFKTLSSSFEHMVLMIQSLMEKVHNEEIVLRKTELKALQAQINPHFLYNTLDSIQWMCEQDNSKDAVKMVGALAKLFRISISHGNEFITISDELKHAESYLIIQSYRYKNQFTYSFDVDKSVLGYMCNKITIQPFIENAIYHGLDRMVDEGEIKIIVRRQGKDIVIIVKDNGLGMTQEQCRTILQKDRSDSKGIGVKNVNDRLKIYFGEEYGITIESELDVGTTVTIKIPKIEKGQEHEY